MTSPCPEIIPVYYTTTLHVIATVSIPINIMTAILVWFKSPGMQKYKHCLIYMQMVSFLTELHMSWICPGYYFFPMIGGYNTGEFFGQFISSHHSMTIWVGVFCFELAAGLVCFVYRHNAVAQINQNVTNCQLVEKTTVFLTHLFPFATAYCMFNSQLTYQQKYGFLKEKFPQCMNWIRSAGFEVYDYELNPWLAVTGIGAFAFVFVIGWYCFYLGVHTMLLLQRLRPHMSPATYQMHKSALISLSMQLVVPGVLIIIPMDLCMYVVVTGSEHLQELATDSMFLIGSHSMVQCIVQIASNPTYRRIVREKMVQIVSLGVLTRGALPVSSVEPSQRTNSWAQVYHQRP